MEYLIGLLNKGVLEVSQIKSILGILKFILKQSLVHNIFIYITVCLLLSIVIHIEDGIWERNSVTRSTCRYFFVAEQPQLLKCMQKNHAVTRVILMKQMLNQENLININLPKTCFCNIRWKRVIVWFAVCFTNFRLI